MKYLKYLFTGFILFFPVTCFAFSDLPESDTHYNSLTYLEYEGVIGGYDDGTVRPNNQINRAELVKILVEGLRKTTKSTHKDCFPDVHEEWFAKYVCYALENDWIAGYPDGTFQPAQNVNKVEALKIILNAFDVPTSDPSGSIFKDTSFDAWYMPYLTAAKNKGLLEETGNYFSPSNFRTRGEVAETVARIMQIDYMDDPVWTDEIGAEFGIFLLLRKLRADNGVTMDLRLRKELTMAARDHAKDMAENIGDMSHEGSDGSMSWDRIQRYYDYPGRAGENVGKGTISTYRSPYSAAKDVHYNIFMPEPDECHNHRTTILAKCLAFVEVGIGVATKNGMMYFAEDFITGEDELTPGGSSQLQVPSEYSASKYDVTLEGDEYMFTTVRGCNNDRVRLEYFIDAGIYMDNGQCAVYEIALNPDGTAGFNVIPDDVYESTLINMNLVSGPYDFNTNEFGDPFVNVYNYGEWEITSHASPYNFDIGDIVQMTLSNTTDSSIVQLRLDFTEEGWISVQQI